MSSEEEFDEVAWRERLRACETLEEMNAVLMEYPVSEEELWRWSSTEPEDLEYCYMAVRRE